MRSSREDYRKDVREAVRHFWNTRDKQSRRQTSVGRRDQGARGSVTGGAQMDGFVELCNRIILKAGIEADCIFLKRRLELPGFFRPTKEWDLVVVKDHQLLVVIEVKSQVGSFGNNFNNRTEEAMGSALDLWTAYREGAFDVTRPWLGYLFLLEDCQKSTTPVSVREPHFPVFDEFRGASYLNRYEIFCRKLLLERHYNGAVLFTSNQAQGMKGAYKEPAEDLGFRNFAKSLHAHAHAFADNENKDSIP